MIWFDIIGALVVLVGLLILFEARRLVKKYFNYGEENTATLGMKIVGVALVLVGGLIMLCIA